MIATLKKLMRRKPPAPEKRPLAKPSGDMQHRSVSEQFTDLRADYRAAKNTRFTRQRQGLPAMGSGADFHIRNESEFLRIIEKSRDMDRNDAVVGATVDRAVQNTMQGGFILEPKTSDPELNDDIARRWLEWSEDADQCDLAGELCFSEIEYMMLRHVFVDGDIVALPNILGPLEILEAHRLRTPSNAQRRTVHGVEMSSSRKRLRYWFTAEDINPNHTAPRLSSMAVVGVRNTEGDRDLFHVLNPKRVSQTRGITAFAPVFELLGMLEDLQFAKLLQAQIVSCFAVFRSRHVEYKAEGVGSKLGPRSVEAGAGGGDDRTIEEISPGMVLNGQAGETLTGFSPNVPNPEFFPHVKMILQLIGINLGLPLVLVLMDGSETNFSGWRGAVDQARLGFRRNQKWMIARFHRPVYRWKLKQWISEDSVLRARSVAMGSDFFRHVWHPPTWPYIEPFKDAKADALRLAENLISPRRIMAERGYTYDDISQEIVDDRSLLIERAVKKAAKMPADVSWRDIANMPAPAGAVAPEPESDDQRAEAAEAAVEAVTA